MAAAPSSGPRPIVVFAAACALLFPLEAWPWFESQVIWRVAEWTTAMVGMVLVAFGVPAEWTGHHLFVASDGLHFSIGGDCVAAPAHVTLIAVAVAVERTHRRRLICAAAACAVFFVVNVVRISSLTWVWRHANGWFDFSHEMVWNGVYFVAITSWVAWSLMRVPADWPLMRVSEV